MIPKGVVTLDEFAVGIDYNKDPYTTNNRFSVIVPDLPSQKKFFTIDNYTHWYLDKLRPNPYANTERYWFRGSSGAGIPENEKAMRETNKGQGTGPEGDQKSGTQYGFKGAQRNEPTTEIYYRPRAEIQAGAKTMLNDGSKGGAGGEDGNGMGLKTAQGRYGDQGNLTAGNFGTSNFKPLGALTQRCSACQFHGVTTKPYCTGYRTSRSPKVGFMKVIKMPGGDLITPTKKAKMNRKGLWLTTYREFHCK